MSRKLYTGIAGLLAAIGLGAWFLPYTPLRSWPIASSFVSADSAVAAALLIAALALAASGLSARRRRPLVFASMLAVLLCALYGGRALTQGVGAGTAARADSVLSFVSWNSGEVDPSSVAAQLAPIIMEVDANVVVLPEVGWLSGEEVGEQLDELGFTNKAFAPESATTSVFLGVDLSQRGNYTIDESTPPWAGVVLRPKTPSPETPVIAGVHIQQPGLTSVDTWQMQLDWILDLCTQHKDLIVIGDFNSTVNSLGGTSLSQCRDVASAHGAGAGATWPAMLPPILGTAIDRFFAGRAYSPQEATFQIRRDVSGSDHWAITGSIPSQ